MPATPLYQEQYGAYSTPADAIKIEKDTYPSAGESKFQQAWRLLENDSSWRDPKQKDAYKTTHGLVEYEDLEFLGAAEIDELSQLLTTVPSRKFLKIIK